MTKKICKQLHSIYAYALGALIILSGICLILGCLSIYYSGEQPYSPEAVATAFAPLAVPIYLCLALVVVGFLLDLFLPREKEKTKLIQQHTAVLKRLHEKADLNSCEPLLRQKILRQQKLRLLHRCICAGLLALGSFLFLCYGLNGDNFHQSEINDSIVQAMCLLLPAMAVPFGYGIFCAFFSRSSMRKEIALLKEVPTLPTKQTSDKKQSTDRSTAILRGGFLLLGAAFLLYGLFTGGVADVLTKAINICTECIGLG